MTNKIFFDGVEITIYPAIIIVIVLGAIAAVLAGIFQYKIKNNEVVRRYNLWVFVFIAVFSVIALIPTLLLSDISDKIRSSCYKTFATAAGESTSYAPVSNAFLIGGTVFIAAVALFFLLLYIGVVTGITRELVLIRKKDKLNRLHH